jgi:hypothetical protein
MKRSIVFTTFLIVAAGAIDMSAGNTADLKGSDTLLDVTNAILAACPGTAGRFVGGGSVDGQNAMIAGTQQVAPMSRFLDGGACAGTGASPTLSARRSRLPIVAVGLRYHRRDRMQRRPEHELPARSNPGRRGYDTSIVGTDNVTYTFSGWRDAFCSPAFSTTTSGPDQRSGLGETATALSGRPRGQLRAFREKWTRPPVKLR